jgi:hypothetical protein
MMKTCTVKMLISEQVNMLTPMYTNIHTRARKFPCKPTYIPTYIHAGFYRRTHAEQELKHVEEGILRDKLQCEETHRVCRQHAQQLAAEYVRSGSVLLTEEEYTEMVYHVLLCTTNTTKRDADDVAQKKYAVLPKELVCGEFEHAAKGFDKLLNVSENEVLKHASAGVTAIEEEVKALGNREVAKQLEYILWQRAKEKRFANGTVRDKGHAGMRLADFLQHPHARTAELHEAEVVALRLYTTAAFQQINEPLRDQARISSGRPHPLPVTVMLIIKGIRKLRAIDANSDGAIQSMVLWRGMRLVTPTDKFAEKGGTEVRVFV